MMREKQRYTVSILGATYDVVSDEESEIVWAVVHKVDALLQDISARTKSSDVQSTAIFAALMLATELNKLERDVQKQTEQVCALADMLEREMTV
jgi:cell division protein ZapA (FtsZ GTPase activity inhibitor)